MQPEQECLIVSYATDTTSSGYHYNFKYDGKRLVEIRGKYWNSFFWQPEDTLFISYNPDNKLNAIGNASKSNLTTKFHYGDDGNLSSKISYSLIPFPTSKTDFEWKDGNISRIRISYYQINGSPNHIENYIERLERVLDLEYNERGNVIYVKIKGYSDVITEIRYEYDSQPNPHKRWHALQGGKSPELMYLLSKNNMTRASYSIKDKYSQVYDSPYQYNDKGYPLHGPFNQRMLNIQYECL